MHKLVNLLFGIVCLLALAIAASATLAAQQAVEASSQARASLRVCEIGLHRADAKLEQVEGLLEIVRDPHGADRYK